jgi:FkbM family methyltransferase
MESEENFVLVEIVGADLFLYYYMDDHALSHQMSDRRARVIAPEDARVQWRFASADPEIAWKLPGLGVLSLASIHYWRQGIDFDYIDIGANVGMTTIGQTIFFRRCGWGTRVHTFEPGPVFDLLERSVLINGVSDAVTCIRAAVGERAGRAQFHVTPAQSPASSLLRGAVDSRGIQRSQTIEVDVTSIDDFVPRSLRAAPGLLIKIDAEGFDFKVLDGMRRSMSERLISFQMELYPALNDAYSNASDRVADLADHYALVDVGSQPHALIVPGEIGSFVAEVRKRTPVPATDIFAVPKRLPNYADLVSRIIAG